MSCVAGRQVEYGTEANALDKSADGATKAYVQHYPGDTYISSIFHHVKLEGLEPSTTYYYRCLPAQLQQRLPQAPRAAAWDKPPHNAARSVVVPS